jgi:hypothetical protein
VVSDDHNAEAGEAALRGIIAGVAQTGGTEELADLAFELASKLADTVERIAQDRGLLALDLLDIMFIDPAEVMSLRSTPGLRAVRERGGEE